MLHNCHSLSGRPIHMTFLFFCFFLILIRLYFLVKFFHFRLYRWQFLLKCQLCRSDHYNQNSAKQFQRARDDDYTCAVNLAYLRCSNTASSGASRIILLRLSASTRLSILCSSDISFENFAQTQAKVLVV